MNKKERIKIFEKELDTINDKSLKNFAKILIENADDYFFKIAASTTGKNHPEYTCGVGGLLLHTKAVIIILNEILKTNMFSITEREQDLLRIAALAHDIKKIGDGKTGYTVKNHPYLATLYVTEIYEKNKSLLKSNDIAYINDAIASHMGQWGGNAPIPSTDSEKLLHISDVIASRKNIQVLFSEEETKKTIPNINEYVVDFGMHNGKHLNEIPKDYLEWAKENITKKPLFTSMLKLYLKEQK